MAFMYMLGRALFVSFFLLSAWQEFKQFGKDGGPAAKTFALKITKLSKHFTTNPDFQVPEFKIKFLVAGAIAMKGIGSLLFVFGSINGAFLLILHQLIATPILYDFYNYDTEKKAFNNLLIKFTQNLALLGGLMFFIEMKTAYTKRTLVHKKAFNSKMVWQ